LRTAIASIDPDIRLDDISTMDEIVGHAFAPWRFTSRVVSTFAAIALMFAITGIATLVAFAVTQRSREIGVRVALGARPLDVVRLVAAEGARVAVAGLATGLFIAWSLRRSVESILFGVRADDATSFVGTAVVLGVVFLGAAYLPARKAARVDPCTTLRSD
jgi:ABC-type antimicrobial peptide transport system permease subunit